MAKLKVKQIRRHICPTCKGNGYLKVASLKVGRGWGETIHQCWDCDSQGELYDYGEGDFLDVEGITVH